MAYRLTRRKRVDNELERIVGKEFEKAQGCLNNHANDQSAEADAVHEARKGVKKIRAVLRLLQKALGTDYDDDTQQLRDVSHQLSSIRDLDAIVEIFDALRHHYPEVVTSSMSASVQRGFQRRKQTTLARLHVDRLLPRVARALEQSAAPTTKHVRRVAATSTVRSGVLQGYRRARKAMDDVHTQPEDALFHKWRRRVKDHEYHVRLMEGLSKPARARVKRLKQLETCLGDDHNLVVMRAAILEAQANFGNTRATAVVLGCAEKYQATLRKRAIKLGGRLFATKPRLFRKSIDRWLQRRA